MSGLFGSTIIKGNRITDFATSGARVGTPLPFGFGEFVVDGNIIWAPMPPKEIRKVRRQGKGGVKQETFTYTLSYAVALARGMIYGIKWLKRNGKVVYTTEPTAPIEDAQFAALWSQKVTFYYGTKTQLPDSTIESYEGTGQVSAFRNLCYFVIEDEDVTANGGAPASYQACLLGSPPEFYLTSEPYAYDTVDNMITQAQLQDGVYKNFVVPYSVPTDNTITTALMADSTLRDVTQVYNVPVENTRTTAQMRDSELVSIVEQYSVPVENTITTAQMRDGEYRVYVVQYDSPVDNTITTASMLDGELV